MDKCEISREKKTRLLGTQNSERIIAFCDSNGLVYSSCTLFCSQALGSLSPAAKLNSIHTTSAWIINKAMEVRGREVEYFTWSNYFEFNRGMIVTVIAKT